MKPSAPSIRAASPLLTRRAESVRWRLELRNLPWVAHFMGQLGALIVVGAGGFLTMTALGVLVGSWPAIIAAIAIGLVGLTVMALGVHRLRTS